MTWQLLANGISDGALYALVAFALALTYGTRRFFDFSLAAVFTTAAYAAFGAVHLGAPSALATGVGLSSGVVLAVAFDQIVFFRLWRRSSGGLEAFLASLGLLVATEAVVAMFCGREAHVLVKGTPARWEIPGVRLASGQQWPVVGAVVFAAIWWFIGRVSPNVLYARAVADDEVLATARGVPGSTVRVFTVVAAGVAAASAGVLRGIDLGVTPTMGLDVLLVAMVAMIVGEARGFLGVGIIAFMLGIAQQLALIAVSARWQSAVVFAVLLASVLLDRSTRRNLLRGGEV